MADNLPAVPGRSIATELHRYELNLSDYWRIIIKRRMFVFASFLMVLILSIIYTNSKTPHTSIEVHT